jgi:hypothetical protein
MKLLLTGVVVVVVAWCGFASGFHRSTTPAKQTWVVSLVFVVATDMLIWAKSRGPADDGARRLLRPAEEPWPRPGKGGARRALIGILPWLFLVLVALAWEILGLDTGPHTPHLTISALSQAYRPLNAGLLLVWMGAGVGYEAARARRPRKEAGTVAANMKGRTARLPAVLPPVAMLAGAFVDRLAASLIALMPAYIAGRMTALLLPASRAAGIAFWLSWMAAFGVCDLLARKSNGAVPNAEEFLRFITRPAWANLALIAAWAYAGWHLFAH